MAYGDGKQPEFRAPQSFLPISPSRQTFFSNLQTPFLSVKYGKVELSQSHTIFLEASILILPLGQAFHWMVACGTHLPSESRTKSFLQTQSDSPATQILNSSILHFEHLSGAFGVSLQLLTTVPFSILFSD